MRRATALAGALMLLTACGGPRPSSPTPADIAAIDVRPDPTIVVDDQGFSPAPLDVRSGDVVRLVNKGTGPHSFTAHDHRFDTRMLAGDDTTLVLTKPAPLAFDDVDAPGHVGSITVMARPTG